MSIRFAGPPYCPLISIRCAWPTPSPHDRYTLRLLSSVYAMRVTISSEEECPVPRVLIATTNAHKIEELGALLVQVGCEFVVPRDLGLDDFDVDETGSTLLENAILKAVSFARKAGLPALADDSGLEVDALGGEPGVRSKRYAGPDATDADRVSLIVSKLAGVAERARTARFRTVLAFATPDAVIGTGSGSVDGRIGLEPFGAHGFGYDPIFLVGGHRPTMAELTPAEKNAISHRSRAVQAIRPVLDTWVASQPPTPSPPDPNTLRFPTPSPADLPTLRSPIGSPLDPRASQGG